MVEWQSESEDHYLEEPFDEDFWLKVEGKFRTGKTRISWNRAMDEVRIERLMAKHGKDTLLVIIRDWPNSDKYKDKPELVASLEYLLSRFTEIVLERDSDQIYKHYRDEEDPTHPTLLHLAAERNFPCVARVLIGRYPLLVNMETEQVGDERVYLPVENALMCYNDETAAYLISEMLPERWVLKQLHKINLTYVVAVVQSAVMMANLKLRLRKKLVYQLSKDRI